ncbi:hypothetical protein MNB_SV-15-1570 [hydrothermal vent metagenome]|uniref:Uncharacterized protein n=1 Tax=hydrothermal vent metagenome TaxID=652676 RepID=A0A1W1EK52_9ZZZZ
MVKQFIIISSLFLIGCGSGDFSNGLPTESINTPQTTTTIDISREEENITNNNEDNITITQTDDGIVEEVLNSNILNEPSVSILDIVYNNLVDITVDANKDNTTENINEEENSTTTENINEEDENNITIEDNNETNSTEEEIFIEVENNDTRPNIILVHGLNSGASIWNSIAPRISNYMKIDNNLTVDVGIEINIDSNAKCFDGAVDGEVLCGDLDNIKSQSKYRSIANDKVFGLKRGDFEVSKVEYQINGDIITQDILQQQKVFAINFSNSNQLSFDAQGYELKRIIDDISMRTGIDNFILIGHSMGGLAIRAYIQNEEIKRVEKVITLNTPHLGANGGIYNDTTKNAGVNLANDSKSYQLLNSNISDKYDNIKFYYLGYSSEISSSDDELYFSSGDGVVDIGSQMGLDILDSYRIIFSPQEETLDTFKYISSNATKEWNDESIEINEFNSLAHNAVLEDEDYIYVIIDIIKM